MKKFFTICLCGLMAASTIACSDDDSSKNGSKDVSPEDFCAHHAECFQRSEDYINRCIKEYNTDLKGPCAKEVQAFMNCRHPLSCENNEYRDADACDAADEASEACYLASSANSD